MESSTASSDAGPSVSNSPEVSVEQVKLEEFSHSVNVSSLAEKFEKGGSDSTKSDEKVTTEERLVTESQMEGNESSESSSKTNDDSNSCLEESKVALQDASQIPKTASEDVVADQTESKSNAQDVLPSIKITEDVSSTVEEIKATNDTHDVQQLPTSAGAVNEGENSRSLSQGSPVLPTETPISTAVEEKVAYFAEKISQAFQESVTSKAAKDKIEPNATPAVDARKASPPGAHYMKYSELVSKISLKDLEKTFVTALNMGNSNASGEEQASEVLSVPSIKITEVSDQEGDSESDEEIAPKTEVGETEVKRPVLNNVEKPEKKAVADKIEEPTPCSSSDCQREKKDESEARKESRPFFYISSSDLPADLTNGGFERSDELRQRSVNLLARERSVRLMQSAETREPSCLCSRSIHGAIFLASFLIAISGFILYNLAHEGKVPDFCEPLGLITAIISGIVGAFSCFCFSFLGAFSQVPLVIPMSEAGNIPAVIVNPRRDAPNLDEASWSPETERAFRRQNGMPSNPTSEESVRSRHSAKRELVEKTEKLKKEVMGLLDSFSEMMARMEPTDEVSDMESGVRKDTSK